jgi:putative tricarboxylic transport membrane protein
LLALPSQVLASPTVLEKLEIIAPASAGGGWDMTARAMQEVLEVTGIAEEVRVTNSPGAGGAIALAQFINARRGEGNVLLVGGHVMLGAIRANQATVSLSDATPIARLTGEYQVIAVPAGSEFQSLQDLLAEMRADPGLISWVGGSRGGTDHALVEMIARAIGVEPVRVNYVPSTGGAEAAAALVAKQAVAGVSGYDEFATDIKAGRLRPLALSSEQPVPGIETPTLKEQGIDVALANWRGVVAPPGISEEQQQALAQAIERMAASPAWDYTLRKHYWTDIYLPGASFAEFVRTEEARMGAGPEPESSSPGGDWAPGFVTTVRRNVRNWLASRQAVTLTLGVLLLLAALFASQRILAKRRERILSHDLEEAREEAERRTREAQELLHGLGEEIEKQFETWTLTSAEKEVGRLMLKGLRHKEIAEIRHTSERTVRQQALSIYRKAGLEGRTDLAAYFLEDLLPPIDRDQGIA